jgi:hypothetical protein
MKDKRSIETKVEEAMQSLEGLKRATPGPFFFTRVQARLSKPEQSTWEMITAFVARPVIAVSVVCFVLLLNATVIFKQAETTPVVKEQQDISLAEEYTIASSSFYDFENQEP